MPVRHRMVGLNVLADHAACCHRAPSATSGPAVLSALPGIENTCWACASLRQLPDLAARHCQRCQPMFSNLDSHDLPAITSLLNAISDPAVLLNLDYEICAANDAYRRTFANEEEILQRHCYEVSHGYRVPCDQAGEHCPLRQCLD